MSNYDEHLRMLEDKHYMVPYDYEECFYCGEFFDPGDLDEGVCFNCSHTRENCLDIMDGGDN